MWNHPDCGYTMSPELLAPHRPPARTWWPYEYSADRADLRTPDGTGGAQNPCLATPMKHDWLDNVVELGWKLYLCSTPPVSLRTAADQRMNEYTRLAFAGQFDQARLVRDSLNPVRETFAGARPERQAPGPCRVLARAARPARRAGAAAPVPAARGASGRPRATALQTAACNCGLAPVPRPRRPFPCGSTSARSCWMWRPRPCCWTRAARAMPPGWHPPRLRHRAMRGLHRAGGRTGNQIVQPLGTAVRQPVGANH